MHGCFFMADNSEKIAEIRTLLESGATSISVDGQTINLDLASLRKELTRLIDTDDATVANMRRPRMSSINMGGFN